MLISGTHILFKLLKIKLATIVNIDMNFSLLEDVLVFKVSTEKLNSIVVSKTKGYSSFSSKYVLPRKVKRIFREWQKIVVSYVLLGCM